MSFSGFVHLQKPAMMEYWVDFFSLPKMAISLLHSVSKWMNLFVGRYTQRAGIRHQLKETYTPSMHSMLFKPFFFCFCVFRFRFCATVNIYWMNNTRMTRLLFRRERKNVFNTNGIHLFLIDFRCAQWPTTNPNECTRVRRTYEQPEPKRWQRRAESSWDTVRNEKRNYCQEIKRERNEKIEEENSYRSTFDVLNRRDDDDDRGFRCSNRTPMSYAQISTINSLNWSSSGCRKCIFYTEIREKSPAYIPNFPPPPVSPSTRTNTYRVWWIYLDFVHTWSKKATKICIMDAPPINTYLYTYMNTSSGENRRNVVWVSGKWYSIHLLDRRFLVPSFLWARTKKQRIYNKNCSWRA